MNTHEYQAKEVLARYSIPIPDFGVASSVQEAKEVIHRLGLKEAVIKIQVHAGGRGKAGGVKFGKTPSEILSYVEKLLGMKMVNEQTGPLGVVAHKVLISRPVDIEKEYYLGAVIDRSQARPILIASYEGGMDIEEVAEKFPEKIATLPISLDGTVKPFHLLRLCKVMQWEGEQAEVGKRIATELARAFLECDASLLEINPLVKAKDGKLWALDAKLSIDDNALFRQPELAKYYDPTQETPSEVSAKKYDLSYVALDGNIGCMVNGAGLAMATMDIIHYYGGKPANFLDVGGSATKEKVAEGFKIILADPKVKAILINVFGGIMNCVTIAEGILHAIKEVQVKVPLVVRLEGTNAEEGRRILKQSGLAISAADSLGDGAKKVVAFLK